MLTTILQKDVFGHNIWTKALRNAILVSRSMFSRPGNPMMPLILTYDHDLWPIKVMIFVKSHFESCLNYYWVKHCQFVTKGIMGDGLSRNQKHILSSLYLRCTRIMGYVGHHFSQRCLWDHKTWTETLKMTIWMTRSMFLMSRNPMVPR